MTQRQCAHLLGQVDGVTARGRPERAAAATEQIDLGWAVAGRAGALLPIHLLAGTVDLASVLHVMGAGLALGQLPHDTALQDVDARLETENLVRDGDAACRLALEGRDLQLHIKRPPSLPQPARRPPAGTCPASANLSAAAS